MMNRTMTETDSHKPQSKISSAFGNFSTKRHEEQENITNFIQHFEDIDDLDVI